MLNVLRQLFSQKFKEYSIKSLSLRGRLDALGKTGDLPSLKICLQKRNKFIPKQCPWLLSYFLERTLSDAAENNHLNIIQFIVETPEIRAKLDLNSYHYINPIIHAARKENLAVIQYLIGLSDFQNKIEQLYENPTDGEMKKINYNIYEEIVDAASIYNHLPIVKFILDNPNLSSQCDMKGRRLLDALEGACHAGSVELVQYLIKKGVKFSHIEEYQCKNEATWLYIKNCKIALAQCQKLKEDYKNCDNVKIRIL